MTNIKQNPSSSGLRYNQGKPRHDLVSWPAINELAKVLTAGSQKYDARNWEKGLSYSDTFASLQRHLTAWYGGEEYDQETGLPHMAHVLCNAMFLQHFALTNTGTDDRPNYNNKKQASVKENSIEQTRSTSRAALREQQDRVIWNAITGTAEQPYEGFGAPVEQGYSGFLSEGNQDAVVHSGLLDLQAHVQPRAVQRGSIARAEPANGRVEGYSEPNPYRYRYPTVSGLNNSRKETFGAIPPETEGHCGRQVPVADGYGYRGEVRLTEPTELRVYDNIGTCTSIHVGNGRFDVRERSGGESST